MIAVITGDMVDSKSMTFQQRESFIMLTESISQQLCPIAEAKVEIFRGDSFQIRVNDTIESLRYAVALRGLFRGTELFGGGKQYDVRLSLGIGAKGFERDELGLSDGDAYRNSGLGLDGMKNARLNVVFPDKNLNEEFSLPTAFADEIISNWTVKQSKANLQKLIWEDSNYEIAERINVRRQTVDKLLKLSNMHLIDLYIKRFKTLIDRL